MTTALPNGSPAGAPQPAPDAASAGATTIRVAVPKPLHTLFTYRVPEGMALPPIGARVRVPFGRQTLVGLRVEPAEIENRPSEGPLRDVVATLDESPLLPGDLLALATWASRYYHHPLGDVIFTALPTLLRRGDPTEKFAESELVLTNDRDPPRAPRQRAALDFIAAAGGRVAPAALTAAGFEARIVHRLIERGALVLRNASIPPPTTPRHPHDIVLNAGQREALDTLRAMPRGVALLEGITGSGKTEVYLRTIDAHLASGEQVLVLVPEIALTPQTVERFEARFGPVHVFHSGHTDLARARVWQACRDGRARIAIGTRSAIWLPFASLGLIVVDEEHDASFKQQEGLRYSARDLAVKRAHELGIPVLLGSATPSLESLHNVARGRYRKLELKERTGGAALPTMALVDIRGHPLDGGMCRSVQRRVRHHLEQGSQVLLFVNRRGYSPTLMCASCGWIAVCSQCDTRLTLHQRPAPSLRCHHCGFSSAAPEACPRCQSDALISLGVGTQRSEQGVERLFPGTPVHRIDRDSVRGADRLEAVLGAVRSGTPAVLVGTQMLAKGHHFPNVTLVVVLNADAGFMSPDFRAPEHTAQLIVQVAGRAGRAERPGEVLIQTYNPDHAVLRALIERGYDGFAAEELAIRAAARMPPHRALALLRAEGNSHEQVMRALEQLVLEQRGRRGLEVLGPAPAPIGKLANRYRSQCLLTADRRTVLHAALDDLVRRHGDKRIAGARWSIDVDPLDTF